MTLPDPEQWDRLRSFILQCLSMLSLSHLDVHDHFDRIYRGESWPGNVQRLLNKLGNTVVGGFSYNGYFKVDILNAMILEGKTLEQRMEDLSYLHTWVLLFSKESNQREFLEFLEGEKAKLL